MAAIRYLVKNVDEAVGFYTELMGFTVEQRFGPAMAIVTKGDLTLWLAGPQSSAAQPLPNGLKPEPGGWNRFVSEVENLQATVDHLKTQGVRFRSDVVAGPGGLQIVCEDPSGNAIELFQPRA